MLLHSGDQMSGRHTNVCQVRITRFRLILGILPFLEDFDPGFDELKSFCIQSLPAVIYFKVGYVFTAIRSTISS